jgi:CubicO group peptidase (beta-lactamase class C family)
MAAAPAEVDLHAEVAGILNRWPAVGLALGVVRDGRLGSFHGHGFANVPSRSPVTQDTAFRIASITKTFTAIAVMQLWEEGSIELDRPADDYLRAYRLIPATPRWRPATIRHLLTHTAGVPQMVRPSQAVRSGWFGESVAPGERAPTLAEHYGEGLRLAAEPGSTFTYTDHGFATLGQIVEDVSGVPLASYLRERVFEPLGMDHTDLVRSERVGARLATGYKVGPKGAKALANREWITAAASSAISTTDDMSRYTAALLGGGSNEFGTVLKPETLELMFEPQYRPDPRIPGIGLSFFRADLGGHRVVEHQGVLPGFNSELVVAPDDGVGVVACTNGSPKALTWLPAELGALLGRLIGAREDRIRTDVPQRPETWADLCGWYRPQAQPTDMQAWTMLGLGVQVLVRRGRLLARPLSPFLAVTGGFELHPDDEDDPDVFRIDLSRWGVGSMRVVFGRDVRGRAARASLDVMPMTLVKRSR